MDVAVWKDVDIVVYVGIAVCVDSDVVVYRDVSEYVADAVVRIVTVPVDEVDGVRLCTDDRLLTTDCEKVADCVLVGGNPDLFVMVGYGDVVYLELDV